MMALYQSIQKVHKGATLKVLVVDASKKWFRTIEQFSEIEYFSPGELDGWKSTLYLKIKYGIFSSSQAFIASLKPVFIRFLVQRFQSNIIYSSASNYFFLKPESLLDELDGNNHVVMVPNFFTLNPEEGLEEFINNFLRGYYNSSLIAFSKDSVEILDWWALACRHACENNNLKGYYYDQAYLNFLPVVFDNVKVIHDKGILIGYWNKNHCVRFRGSEIKINDEFPVTAIHFDPKTIAEIASGNDKHLEPLLKLYYKSYRR
ncbi:MAG: hypothetical protein ABJ004_07510 [Cyclobacteriaceae bacterium]